MCQNCNGRCNGLGATRPPVQKVTTTTAPIYTPPITPQITTSGMAQQVYSPTVNPNGGFWGGLTDLASGVFDFINTNNQNKAMVQAQQAAYQNQLNYGFQQQQPQQYLQPQQQAGMAIDGGKIMKGVLLAGVIIGGIYLIKK